MKRSLGLLLVCAVLMSACGSGDPTGRQREATETSQRPKPPEYTILSKAELQSAVLPIKDLPAGFGEDPDGDGKETDKTYCDYEPPFRASTYAEGNFLKGGGFSAEVLFVGLRQFDDTRQSSAAYKALIDTMKTCRKDTMDGDPVKFSVLSTPELEDGSIGISVVTDEYSVPQFFALVGPTMIAVGGGGLMKTDPDMLIDLLKDQIERYKDAAKS